jgi:hypothetical protein
MISLTTAGRRSRSCSWLVARSYVRQSLSTLSGARNSWMTLGAAHTPHRSRQHSGNIIRRLGRIEAKCAVVSALLPRGQMAASLATEHRHMALVQDRDVGNQNLKRVTAGLAWRICFNVSSVSHAVARPLAVCRVNKPKGASISWQGTGPDGVGSKAKRLGLHAADPWGRTLR